MRELAHRVSVELPRSKMNCVRWNNHEAVSEARSQQWKSAFAEELQNKQNDLDAQASDCSVAVFLEKTPTQIVVTADLDAGSGRQYLIASIPRTDIPTESGASSSLRLEKELLWDQSERILDAILIRGTNSASDRLIVLQKESLVSYAKQAGAWKVLDSKPLGDAAVNSRAPRGELHFSVNDPDRLKLVLARKTCQAILNDASALNCQQSAELARTGMLLASTCSDLQVWWLRGDGGDMTSPDRLELLSSPSAQTPSAELSMPGPVVAISSGEGVMADTAVVFNLVTGNYEVYRISLACRF